MAGTGQGGRFSLSGLKFISSPGTFPNAVDDDDQSGSVPAQNGGLAKLCSDFRLVLTDSQLTAANSSALRGRVE